MGVPTPIMNIQHNPFNLPPPVPMHLHSGLPLVQVAASSSMSQGPPPPPPPPPPSQQINFIASQLDGQQLQVPILVVKKPSKLLIYVDVFNAKSCMDGWILY